MLWLQILNGFPCALTPSCWKCFQHKINWGVRRSLPWQRAGWKQVVLLVPGLLIEILVCSEPWLLIKHKINRYQPETHCFCCQNLFCFYYLLHYCCWVEWVNRNDEKESIKSVENPNQYFFVSNLGHSCILQNQRSRSWARKEEIWTRQTPWAPSQIHAHGSNQWKWWKVWRRNTGIFLEMGGKKQHMECKLSTKRIWGISAN